MLRSILHAIPHTAQTDPNKFPPYQYRPYPRQMTHIVNGKPVPYTGPDGRPVEVNDATEEAQFKVRHGQAVDAEEPAKTVAVETKPVTLAAIAATEAPAKRKYTKRALPADLPA